MKVILETSLDPIPCGAEPWQIACSTANKVEYLKKKVYFEVQHGLCIGSRLEDYRLYKKDGTILRDAETLMYYELTETDTVHMRERSARPIHVFWQLQCYEIWVRSGLLVKDIVNRVCMKLASQLCTGTGNPDKFELLRLGHGSGEEGSSALLRLAEADNSPLPWNSTLEQLGFGENPELRLRERTRSRVASRSSSIGASTQIIIRVDTPPPLALNSLDILQSLADPATPPSGLTIKPDDVTAASFHVNWWEPSVDNTNDPITAYTLVYGETNGTFQKSISLSGQVEEHTVTGLKPHTQYYVKVAAENSAGRGPFCEPVLLQTAPDKPVAAPENVQLKVPEDKLSIFVTWSPVRKQYYNSDTLTGYHVIYTPSSKDCRGGTVLVPPHSTKCAINFLDKGVAYAISVAAGNRIGIGPYSTPSVAIVGREREDHVPSSSTEKLDVHVQTEDFREDSLPFSDFTQTNPLPSSDGGLSPVPATIQPRQSKGGCSETDFNLRVPTPTDPEEKLLHLLSPLLDNLPLELPPPDVSIQDLSQKYWLIYIVILDITVKPYLVDTLQCVGHTIKELCGLLRLPNPSEWYLSKSHGLQVLMSGKSKFQPAVGLSRKKINKGKKPCFSVGTALTSLDVDSILDVTQQWKEIELKSQPYIVHLRPWDGRVVERMLEDVDFGLVDDTELGQQVYQQWYRVTQGHHPVNKATAAEIAALMCQAKFRDGSPSQNELKDAVSSCLPDKHRRKKSVRDIAIRKYSDLLLKETSPEAAAQLLVGCVSDLPANNGIFFRIKVPSRGSLVPRMKEGVFGVGLKEIVYLDGETAEVLMRKTYKQINCFHASHDAIIIDFGAHGVEAFEASTSRAFDILHIVKMYIQQQPILDERPSVIPHYNSGSLESVRSQIQLHDSFPMLEESHLWEQAKSNHLCKD